MMLETLGRSRNTAIAAFVLGVIFNYLLSYYLAFVYAILFVGSVAASAAFKKYGVTREQIYEVLRVPPRAREFVDSTFPPQKPANLSPGRPEIPDPFRYVGADLFHQSLSPSGSRQHLQQQQQRSLQAQMSLSPAASRERMKIVNTVKSSPGPALSSTRFRSNLDFSLNAEVNSAGFSGRIVNYHHQDITTLDNPSSPRPQIGEFHNVRLNQEATPVRRVNLSAQVGLPLIISPPMAQPNFYNQCLPPEDKSASLEPSPSVLDALKEISRKRISHDDNHPPAGMKRYRNEMINAANEFPAIIKETSSRMISKRMREVVELSPENSQPTKVAKLAKSNEIEASLSSSKMYQKQRAEAMKRRAANANLHEPETKSVRTVEPLQRTPEVKVVREIVPSPRSLFDETIDSTTMLAPAPSAKKRQPSALNDLYSPVRLEEKSKSSKQLSNKELREKKLQGLMDALRDYEEPEIVEVLKPEDSTGRFSNPLASINSVTSVTTSIQGPVVSSTSPATTKIAPSPLLAVPTTEVAKSAVSTLATFNLGLVSSSKPCLPESPAIMASPSPTTTPSTGFQLAAASTVATTSAPSIPTMSVASKAPTSLTTAYDLPQTLPAMYNLASLATSKASTTSDQTQTFNLFSDSGKEAPTLNTLASRPAFSFHNSAAPPPSAPTTTTLSTPAPSFNFGGAAKTNTDTSCQLPAFNAAPTMQSFNFKTSTTTAMVPSFFTSTMTSTAPTPTFNLSATSAAPAFNLSATTAPSLASAATPPMFGAGSNASPAFGSTSTSVSSGFGTAGSGAGSFGSSAAATTTTAMFGAPTNSAFGGTPVTAAPSQLAFSTSVGSSGIFGATAITAASTAFGTTTAPSTQTFGFGTPTITPASTLPAFSTLTNTCSPFSATSAAPAFGTNISAAATPATTAAASPFGGFGFAAQPAAPTFGPFTSGAAPPSNSIFGGAIMSTTAPNTGAFSPAPLTVASSFGSAFTPTSTVPGGSLFGSSFNAPADNQSSSIFGGAAAAAASPSFGGKKNEPAPLPTGFKFGGDKTDSSPAAAASLFGVPPTQNPFGGAATALGAFPFGGGQGANNNQPQQPPPAYNFSAGTAVAAQAGAAPFAYTNNQPAAAGAFAFNATQQPNPFLHNQPPAQQQGGFNIGTGAAPRRQALQARRRR